VHLLAELLDNAAACSPPAAPVVVTAAGDGDGHLIEVADRGFGMTDQELAWANRRLAGDIAADPAGLVAGDRLGLLVAARLAARNGFGIRLDRSPGPGPAMLTAGRPRPVRFCAEPWRSNHRSAVTGATSERTPEGPSTRPGQGASADSPIAAVLTQTIASQRLPLPPYAR
jgi:hypothetical protein